MARRAVMSPEFEVALRPGRKRAFAPEQKALPFTFFEFFAGGGMARAGLGPNWTCLFANDIDLKKSAIYRRNWGDDVLITKDVGKVTSSEIPGTPNLIWASFPCQDLSLAGA